ncbi:TIGR04197 family type VII secretion effector [Staphylococcus caprae]|uniref:TIGR04197 family type VII secretion effector n=1 Tax=Staphylococcus TaxID=1279 RepID=UPI0008A93A05|nr:TIGR04197 family type VII secretion effector [Staphylococcus sp. HMSC036D05]OHO71471.1 hypothetical protein HMPREF2580_09135 [Staphylococcus sp. HMSC036D05]
MGEVKVETGSTSSKINNISSAGSNIKFNVTNDSLDSTNISPFVGFASAIELVSSAMSNYSSIVTQDATAMNNAVEDFSDNDQNLANQINQNTSGLN